LHLNPNCQNPSLINIPLSRRPLLFPHKFLKRLSLARNFCNLCLPQKTLQVCQHLTMYYCPCVSFLFFFVYRSLHIMISLDYFLLFFWLFPFDSMVSTSVPYFLFYFCLFSFFSLVQRSRFLDFFFFFSVVYYSRMPS
jgi:hypothetical protein